MPKLGDVIAGVGYPQFDTVLDEDSIEGRVVEIAQDIKFTAGDIIQIFPKRRDAMLPTPCFETDARFDFGMSGGPVFGADGFVCGIISSGYDLSGEHEGYSSFASWAPYVYTFSVRDGENERLIYDLAQDGLIKTDEYFVHLRVDRHENGTLSLQVPNI